MTQLINEVKSTLQDIKRPEYSEAAKFAAAGSLFLGFMAWGLLMTLFIKL